MLRARGATGNEDQVGGAGPLWAWAIVTLLIPVVGLVVGLVYLFRNRIGPGLALVIESVALITIYAVLLASANAAPGDSAGLFVAQRAWGTPPCGQPHVEVSTPAGYLARTGTGVFDGEPEAWADTARCAIVINPDFTIHTATKRCHVIVHEWGHLAGHAHSPNPRSVMYGTDPVTEGREFLSKHRWRWTAAGAFPPCYAVTARGAGFG